MWIYETILKLSLVWWKRIKKKTALVTLEKDTGASTDGSDYVNNDDRFEGSLGRWIESEAQGAKTYYRLKQLKNVKLT